MKLKIILLIILTIGLSNCTTYVTTPLPLPSEPLVKPYKEDLECLDTNTIGLIVKAFKRVKTLESIIESTH